MGADGGDLWTSGGSLYAGCIAASLFGRMPQGRGDYAERKGTGVSGNRNRAGFFGIVPEKGDTGRTGDGRRAGLPVP